MRRKWWLIVLTIVAVCCLCVPAETARAIEDSITIVAEEDYFRLEPNEARHIVIGEGIESIPDEAFIGWTALESVTLSSDVTTIGDNAFKDCASLKNVSVSSGKTSNVTNIGDGAFENCKVLKSVDLSKVTSIGNRVFCNCVTLENLDLSKVTSIGNRVFYNCATLKNLDLSNMTEIGPSSFYGCTSLESVNLSNVKKIGGDAFNGCANLKEVALPETAILETIGIGAFENTALTAFNWPSTITAIPDRVFCDCTELISVTLPEGVTSIGINAFSNTALTTITIPASVTVISNGAFSGTPLTSVTLPESLTSMGYIGESNLAIGTFENCTALTSVTLPSGLTQIGKKDFKGCSSLTTIKCGEHENTLPATLQTVGEEAFVGTGLTALTYTEHLNASRDSFPAGIKLTAQPDSKNDHEWNVVWTWDGYSSATATLRCTKDAMGDHSEEQIATGTAITAQITTPATCTTTGVKTYTASVKFDANGATYTNSTTEILPAAHRWSTTWSSDETHHWHNCLNENCPVTENSQKDGYGAHSGTDDDDCSTAVACATCGRILTAAQQHDFGSWTSNENGTHTRSCQHDGCSVTETEDCVFANGVCTFCGYEQPAEPEPEEPGTDVPSRPSTPEPDGPTTGDSDGWLDIADELADADEGDAVTVDMGEETEVPAEIFETIAGKDVTLDFDMGDGLIWTVNGQDIPAGATLADLDLGVALGTSGIPVEVINAITGERTSVQITLAYDGEFGFVLSLMAPLGAENAGLWANLYHFDGDAGRMDFESASVVDAEGNVSLPFSHASQFAIILDDHSHAVITLPFTDVDEDDWFYEPVCWIYGEGLMTGVSDALFAPDLAMSRAMLVSMLARLENVTESESVGFSDVAESDWYAVAVNWAAREGIVGGFEDGSFQPNAPLTREQLASILYRYAAYKGYDVSARTELSHYTDAPSAWAEEVVQWAVAEGLLRGVTGDELQPQKSATRAEVAAIFQRFLADVR